MYKILNKKEIREFIEKYLKEWKGDIHKITMISYGKEKEYLINDGVLMIEKNNNLIFNDL